MNKGLWIGIGAAGLALLAALRLTGGERGHEPLGPGVEGGVVQGPGEPEPLSRPEAAEDGVAPVEVAPAGSPAREPTLPGPWAERPIVVHGRLVELLEIGERQPSRPAAGHRISLEAGRRGGPVVEAVTRSDGSFRFELEPREARPFYFTLRVDGDPRYRPIRRPTFLRRGQSESKPQLLQRVVRGAPRGQVVDRNSHPLSGVAIWCGPDPRDEPDLFSGLDGTFELTGREEFDLHSYRAEGYRLLREKPSVPRKLGGWSTGVLTLGAVTDLVVRVIDGSGGPIRGAEVQVLPADEGPGSGSRATADETGHAVLSGVWCERPLEVRVRTDGSEDSAHLHRAGELVFEESGRGEAIVLHPGSPAELTARVAERLRLFVEVGNREDRDLWVRVRSAVDPDFDVPVGGERDGVFSCAVPASVRGGPLVVTAREAPPDKWSLSMAEVEQQLRLEKLGAPTAEAPQRIAREVVDPGQATDGHLEVSLELTPALSIRGSIVAGSGSRPEIWAIFPGASAPFEAHRESEAVFSWVDDGAFVLPDLAPGRYDLVLTTHRGNWGGAVEIVPGVLAGTAGLELGLPVADDVLLRLVPEDETVPMKEIRVLTERHVSAAPGVRGVSPGRLDRPTAWSKVLSSWRGILGSNAEEISVILDMKRFRDRSVAQLPPTQSGDYRIAVLAESSGGTEYAAVTGPVMHLTAGEHTLRYALIPTGEVKVDCSRIRGRGQRVRLFHAERGDVPLDDRNARRELEVKRRMNLYLRRIPVGEYELRAGTAEQLEAGRPTWVTPVEVRADERTRARLGPE